MPGAARHPEDLHCLSNLCHLRLEVGVLVGVIPQVGVCGEPRVQVGVRWVWLVSMVFVAGDLPLLVLSSTRSCQVVLTVLVVLIS